MTIQCTDLDESRVTQTDKPICEECIKTGDVWVQINNRSAKEVHIPR